MPNPWYPKTTRDIEGRDNAIKHVENEYHLDELVEDIRYQIDEAKILQAIGRGRGVRREEDKPLFIDIQK